MDIAIWIICVLAGLAIGYFTASWLSKKQALSRANVIIDEANREAEVIKEKTILIKAHTAKPTVRVSTPSPALAMRKP